MAAKTQPQRDDDLNLAGWLLVSRLPGTTQFGEEKKNIPGSIHVYNCNEVRVSRCIPLKGLTQCSRKPFEVNKLFTFLSFRVFGKVSDILHMLDNAYNLGSNEKFINVINIYLI